MQLTNSNQKITEIGLLITAGIASWLSAGEIVVSLLDEDRMTLSEIAAKSDNANLSATLLAKFEQLGRAQLLPELLLATYAAAPRMRELPISEQRRLIQEPVEVLVKGATGPDSLLVKVENLTPDQCKQVFDGQIVRGLPAQRAYIESNRNKPTTKGDTVQHMPYKITGKKVVFQATCQLSAQEIAQILSQIS